MPKSFSVRISKRAADVDSGQVSQWLDSFCESPRQLASDPGAGERILRLSLDEEKVEQGASHAGESAAIFLRRLIATNSNVPAEEDDADSAPKVKPPVLKGALKLRSDQIRPLIDLGDVIQSQIVRNAFKFRPDDPEALQVAAYTEAEREQLASASVEFINRRAPRWLVENADGVSLLLAIIAVESRVVERVNALAKRRDQQGQPAETPQPEIAVGVQ